MGGCASKPPKPNPYAPCEADEDAASPSIMKDGVSSDKESNSVSSFFASYTPSPFLHKNSPAGTTPKGNLTPFRFLQRPFPPPSSAKHIRALLRRRQSNKKAAAAIPEVEGEVIELDKRFGFSKELRNKLEMGDEVGRGHFGYRCSAKYKKGEFKDQKVAVKVIPKSKVQ